MDSINPHLERVRRHIPLGRIELSPPVVALSFLLCSAILIAAFKNVRRWRLPLPPGPRGLPIIGNVLDLPLEKPWEVYRNWAQKYGDVVYLEVLGKPLIVLGSAEASIELQERRSPNYSGRPYFPAIEIVGIHWNIANMDYGSDWKIRRRLFHEHFNNKTVTEYSPVYEQQLPNLLQKLLHDRAKFAQHIRGYLGLCIMRICYGVGDDEYTRSLIEDAETTLAAFGEVMTPGKYLVNDFPILRYIPSWFPGAGWKRRLEEFAQAGERLIKIPFDNVRQSLRDGKPPSSTSVALKIIEALPNVYEDDPRWNSEESIGRHTVGVAYAAGVDTTSGSAMAIILALAMYPEVQRRAQAEIDAVIGSDRLPTLSDRPRLPYLCALFKESLRWHTMVPLAPVRRSAAEDEYHGYRIPANATVFTNNWALLHDPETFEDPLEFKPERFLKDGKLHVPTKIDPEYTAFGNGRRICPGRYLASDMLFVMVATILATFNVEPARDANDNPIPLKLEAEPFFISMPLPFQCEIRPRSPRHENFILTLNSN